MAEQIFSGEFCKICHNIYSVEHLRIAAPGIFLSKDNDGKKQKSL